MFAHILFCLQFCSLPSPLPPTSVPRLIYLVTWFKIMTWTHLFCLTVQHCHRMKLTHEFTQTLCHRSWRQRGICMLHSCECCQSTEEISPYSLFLSPESKAFVWQDSRCSSKSPAWEQSLVVRQKGTELREGSSWWLFDAHLLPLVDRQREKDLRWKTDF